jgi:hypothetical protein
MKKPNNCEQCPAVEINKGEIACGCMRTLKAKAHDPQEKFQMWRKCPLAWGKEENNKNIKNV